MTSTILKFGTKAETLSNLKNVIKSANILPLEFITAKEWREEKELCLKHFFQKFQGKKVIVRSSCRTEDSSDQSNAGAYLSLLNIEMHSLSSAIDQIFSSYNTATDDDQVLIQPMLQGVVRSGVCFSHDPNTSAPYRIISWAEGADTTLITSGGAGTTYQIAAGTARPLPRAIAPVRKLLDELLQIFQHVPIDIEFALTGEREKERLWLLQVRPLILVEKGQSIDEQSNKLCLLETKITEGMKRHPSLLGQTTVYGVMPDWNPAEIIGLRPKPLALSLYRELITDGIWAYQRDNYGYRNLRSFPVMVNFFGLPYIDVRVSFNSFIPKILDDRIGERLVEYYLSRLVAEPHLHDKVEFDIVLSCYSLDIDERLQTLLKHSFDEVDLRDIKNSLRNLTNKLIVPETPLWKQDLQKLDVLRQRHAELMRSDFQPIQKLYWIIEDIKRYGTLPFSGLARVGFIAVQFLDSLVSQGYLNKADRTNFMLSIKTISSQIVEDKTSLDRESFLKKYGHLRPGTYDICSARYDENPEVYFDWDKSNARKANRKTFTLDDRVLKKIDKALHEHGLKVDTLQLLKFIENGIIMRELAKFNFSHCLSDALEILASFGRDLGFSREEMAYTDIQMFKELYFSVEDPKEKIALSMKNGKKAYRDTLDVCLPPLITRPEQVWCFNWPSVKPNFITLQVVEAQVVELENGGSIENTIVCIPNADPGFDWLFSHKIKGLITAWGGVNSHMAIRAGEINLPAVIGAGEALYKKWASSNILRIDCSSEKVEVIR